jgi:hypothetical protein
MQVDALLSHTPRNLSELAISNKQNTFYVCSVINKLINYTKSYQNEHNNRTNNYGGDYR